MVRSQFASPKGRALAERSVQEKAAMRFRNLVLVAALVCPTVPVSATAFAEGKEKVVKLDQLKKASSS